VLVERQLDAFESLAVGPDEPDHVRRQRALRIAALPGIDEHQPVRASLIRTSLDPPRRLDVHPPVDPGEVACALNEASSLVQREAQLLRKDLRKYMRFGGVDSVDSDRHRLHVERQ